MSGFPPGQLRGIPLPSPSNVHTTNRTTVVHTKYPVGVDRPGATKLLTEMIFQSIYCSLRTLYRRASCIFFCERSGYSGSRDSWQRGVC